MAAKIITVRKAALQPTTQAWPAMGLALAVSGAFALSACGSGASTTASALHTAQGGPSPQSIEVGQRTTTQPASTATPKAPGQAGQPSPAPNRRSAPAPAFTRQSGSSGSSEGLGGALRVLGAYGFSASDTSTYDREHTLRVVIGTRSGSSDGYSHQAFFFEDERYLGTDASASSASIKVVSEQDTEVTLAYELYRPHDSLCCPSGGTTRVRFQLDNGRLQALDPIPPASSATTSGRNRPGG